MGGQYDDCAEALLEASGAALAMVVVFAGSLGHGFRYYGELVAQVDAAHERADALPDAKSLAVRCSAGCAHAETGCCSVIVLIERTEAEYIVARNRAACVRAFPKLVEYSARLERASEHDVRAMFEDRGAEKRAASAYHQMRMPCAFLDDARRCTIYRDRPLACRTHFVLSDPALCSSEVPDDERHVTLDKGTRMAAQAHLCSEVSRVRGALRFGTLPQVVLDVLRRS
jgi:Fe-S-cluster containining protein